MSRKTLVAVFSASGVTKKVGKEIVPFCTSGGSGVGRSDTALHKNVTGDAKWAKGKQINRPNEATIRRWLDEIL